MLLVPKAIRKEAGAVLQAWLPAKPIYFLVSADAGQVLTCTLEALRNKSLGRAGPGFRGTGSAPFGCVHRVLYSPQSDTC